MEFSAPAKINLSLRVVRRREDGFHEIDSLLVPISLSDRIDIELRDDGGLDFTCDDPGVPADETNLVVRAARLFCAEAGIEPQMRIHLEKRIPHGAGLGGGSSDAAATLLALDKLSDAAFPRETLLRLAAELGSDVPFFILGRPARARGRGELLDVSRFPHRLPLLLLKPPFAVPTPWAYQRWRDSRELPGVRYSAQPQPWGELVNDLERPVFEKHLLLATLKSWLLRQPECAGALMSGSGSTVFAVLRDKADSNPLADRAAAEFGPTLWCCATETITA
ncbi:MAG: 4-(cytidine 5'-diphospho)-2-C-methyl-D-erythritol kinase [Chthoniobacteraceae bacterium]